MGSAILQMYFFLYSKFHSIEKCAYGSGRSGYGYNIFLYVSNVDMLLETDEQIHIHKGIFASFNAWDIANLRQIFI